ncbi:MAG: aminoglycoside phosphotransferase family protein [Anaerolineales bacterium]
MNDNKRLGHYLSAWGLSNPQLLTQTLTSYIYTVTQGDDTAILKLLSESETEEQRGAAALRHLDGRGVVRLLRYDENAHLMEYASGVELITLVERGEDEAATRIIAQVLKQIHSIPHKPLVEGLLGLDQWFGELFNKAAADRLAGIDSIYVRSASLAKQLLADPRDVCVLHGDIHHRNIRQSPRGWLAFDPKGVFGERTYDCANTLCNPPISELVHNERRLLANAAILADALAIDLSRVLAFTYAYACLNASQWVLRLGKDDIAEELIDWHLKVAKIIEPHIDL